MFPGILVTFSVLNGSTLSPMQSFVIIPLFLVALNRNGTKGTFKQQFKIGQSFWDIETSESRKTSRDGGRICKSGSI